MADTTPTLIIGHTLMGKGAVGANEEDFSNKVSTHGQPLSAAGASFENTVANLGGDPQNPFVIFPDVQEYYAQVLEEKRAQAKQKKAEQAAWEKANPELAAKFHRFMSGEAPAIDYKAIAHKANIATRQASADVLVTLAQEVENMIVSSADLSNSDKTDGFIKGGARNLVKGDFSGKFLQAGVAELTMAAICNGIALHGGIHVACATFFVFSDYMKPAFRLSALMQMPVKYIWTHDAFRVGDGRRSYPPADRARSPVASAGKNAEPRRKNEHAGFTSGRCSRNFGGLENGDGKYRNSDGSRIVPSEYQRSAGRNRPLYRSFKSRKRSLHRTEKR